MFGSCHVEQHFNTESSISHMNFDVSERSGNKLLGKYRWFLLKFFTSQELLVSCLGYTVFIDCEVSLVLLFSKFRFVSRYFSFRFSKLYGNDKLRFSVKESSQVVWGSSEFVGSPSLTISELTSFSLAFFFLLTSSLF